MLFKLFKKKSEAEVPDKEKNKKKAQRTIEDEIAKQEERERKKKEQGPNIVPIYILGISILAGIFFWAYGIFLESGLDGLIESVPDLTQDEQPAGKMTNRDGLIIFERE